METRVAHHVDADDALAALLGLAHVAVRNVAVRGLALGRGGLAEALEVMLTHAEQADEEVKKQLKELYAQYKGTKYTVAVFLSGKRDLYEDTRALLLFNRRRAAERAVQARKAAGQ